MQKGRRNLNKRYETREGMVGTCDMEARQGEEERDDSNKARFLTMSRTNTRQARAEKRDQD